MEQGLRTAADAVLQRAVAAHPGVPGVVAVATDRAGDIYVGAAGRRVAGGDAAMTADTVMAIFSTTKALTGTAALQLVEDGRLDLDAPAKAYLPALGDMKVIEGFDASGAPRLRAPRRDITTRMLLLHTAGFGYDFFNEHYARLARHHGQPSVATATKASLATPLLFDPGDAWEYGSNIDWVGQVIEAIAGRRLGTVMQERILGPLGMGSTAFDLSPDMRSRAAGMHARKPDGTLGAIPGWGLTPDPEIHMGGGGLYSTALDYTKFIRMWLDDGMGPGGRVLARETVEMAARDHLGGMKIKRLSGVIPALSNDAEFFPGMAKSWGLTFMINDEPAPTGRPAGALAWAGLANLYYWIDRENGIGGFWGTQILPFADPASIGGYLEFETAVYRTMADRRQAA